MFWPLRKRIWIRKGSKKELRQRIASVETTLNEIRLDINDIDNRLLPLENANLPELSEDERFGNNPGEE